MSGNLKLIDSSGAIVRNTQPQEKQLKYFNEDDSKKLLGLCNEELNNLEKKWKVKRLEERPIVEIYCDPVKEKECQRDVDRLQECIGNLPSEAIDCRNQPISREEILRILNKQVGVICIPAKCCDSPLRIFAKNRDDLDRAKKDLTGMSDRTVHRPSSRQNRSFSNLVYDYTDPAKDGAFGGSKVYDYADSVTDGAFGGSKVYAYADSVKDRASVGSTGSLPDNKFEFFLLSNGLTVKIYKGAITKLNVDAVVNAANEHLANGAGVAGALSKAGGYEFDRECRDFVRTNGNIPVTRNTVTGAGSMHYYGVIHAVGPQWYKFKDKTECVEKVRDTVVEILKTSEKFGYRSVAMPPISSGLFGVPTDLCAAMYVLGIVNFSEKFRNLNKLVEFYIIDTNDDILDMVIDYFEKWRKNPSALDPYRLVSRHPNVTKGDNYNNDWQGKRDWNTRQGPRHSQGQGHSGSQGHGGNQGYEGHSGDQKKGDGKEWSNGQGRFKSQGGGLDQREMQGRVRPHNKPCTFENDCFIFRGKLKVKIYREDIIQCDVDAIVATDGREHKGAISLAIEKENGSSWSQSFKKLKDIFVGNKRGLGQVFMEKPHKMKHLRCIYYIIMERFSPSFPPSHTQLQELKRVVLEVLGQANSLPHIKKNKKGKKNTKPLTKMAMSIPGAGSLEIPLYIEKCSEVMFEAFDEFARKNSTLQLQEVHVVDMREHIIVKGMRKTFRDIVSSFDKRSLPPAPRQSHKPQEFPSGYYENHNDLGPLRKGSKFWPEKYQKIAEWRSNKNGSNETLNMTNFFNDATKSRGKLKILGGDFNTSGSGSVREGATCGDQVEDSCVICMDSFDEPVKLNRCGHMFCKECISESFHQKPVCPICTTVYAVVQGDQPVDGTATVYRDDSSLPGYSGYKTLIINYIFPDGTQDEEHPDPGQGFRGLNRQCYLPDNPQGCKVLQMLEEAFKQRLTFTVGQSRTTGENNVVTWNDIHHKTRRDGGPEKFGYPDNEYLDRVTEELNAKGII